MYFFNEPLADYAVECFKQARFATVEEVEVFFQLFTPGNTLCLKDRPLERFADYEELLTRLHTADAAKYQRIHKGLPFVFMSWLAFDLVKYDKALFYLDAALSEDIRNFSGGWQGMHAARFLLLDPQSNDSARRTMEEIKKRLDSELSRFNKVSGESLTLPVFVKRFATPLLQTPAQRTIISALYIFVLEFDERLRELRSREGSRGGSNRPFTVHLFTGGLLLESILKYCYPSHRQLGSIFHDKAFQTDFGLTTAPRTSAAALADIVAAINGSNSVETALSTAAKLRNTTGHNLVWDDVFGKPDNYRELFHQVMNAVFFAILKMFV
ncbi:MAG: hypothetical protein HY820_05365 [Acidobacteria bacterium]|nr:hypothetical protein [Acidobacteriota bacterium]